MSSEEDCSVRAAGPIGVALAAWRLRRALTPEALSSRCGLGADRITALEVGTDWVDRRGDLAGLAVALRLDPAELAGQPYPPVGVEHARVHAAAFHLRRALTEPSQSSPSATLDELTERTAAALEAQDAGAEDRLAEYLPGLIKLVDAARASTPAARHRLAELRVGVHVAAAGLMRRLGYKDLAWMLLHRARPGGAEPPAVLLEEVRLLIDLGMPEYALARAERAEAVADVQSLSLLRALAHAMAHRPEQAAVLLGDAGARAQDARQAATVAAAGVAAAAEVGRLRQALDLAYAVSVGHLPAAERSAHLVISAGVAARTGRLDLAADRLDAADGAAPWRMRLDPFARELLAVLPQQAEEAALASRLERTATRARVR